MKREDFDENVPLRQNHILALSHALCVHADLKSVPRSFAASTATWPERGDGKTIRRTNRVRVAVLLHELRSVSGALTWGWVGVGGEGRRASNH